MPDCTFACRVDAYYDGELDGEALAGFEAHLTDCAACREELESLRSLTGHFSTTTTSELISSELRDLYAIAKKPAERPLGGFAVGLLATAASLLVVGTAWLMEIPRLAPATPTVAVREVPDWEQFAMGGPVTPAPGLDDRTAVAENDLADWMLSGLSAGREP